VETLATDEDICRRDYAGRVEMTDEELIAMYKRMDGTDEFKRIVALAELGIPRKSPEGSILIRIAAAACDEAAIEVCAFPVTQMTPDEALTECKGELSGQATHAAIVTAWLPPVVTPEVQGEVGG
jgi:hypothetical protein